MVLARTLQTGLLLALSAKAEAVRLLVIVRRLRRLSTKEGGAELGSGKVSDVHGELTGSVACPPNADAALGLCVLTEDEAKHHVQAAHREEEKRSDERELAHVVGEDRGTDAEWAIHTIRAQLRRAWHEGKEGGDSQSLEDPERAKAKLRPEHREKAIEEGHRPGDLG